MRRKIQLAIGCLILALAAGATTLQAQGTTDQNQMGPGMMGGRHMGRGSMGRGPMMGGRMMGSGCGMMGESGETFIKGRIAFLRAELGITDTQKPLFEKYATAISENLESMQAMHQTMMASVTESSPVDRLETHLTMMESRLSALKKTKPALDALYAALDDEQKKKADRLLTGMGCMM